MRVCKPWLQACKDPCLNSVFDLETHFDSVTELPRFWTSEFESRIDNMIGLVVGWSNGSLAEIRVRHCSDRSLSLVAQRCPNIQVLSIKSSPRVSDVIMTEIASGCPNLKELDVSYCYQISHKSLATIGLHCPSLHILRRNLMNFVDPSQHVGIVQNEYLNDYPPDGDLEVAAIGKFMPHLVQVELQFSKLTGKGLALLCEGCQDLEYIDLSGCGRVSRHAIEYASSNLKKLKTIKKPKFYRPRCPNIQVLSIKSCPHVSDVIMTEIASGCPNLKELDVSCCYQISHKSLATIGLHCPSLHILRRNLMNLVDPSQHVGIVQNEYLNAYPPDGDLEVAAIGKFMPHLVQLELQFSNLTGKGLALLSEGCQDLEYIDLSGCGRVRRHAIEYASSNLKKLKTIKTPKFYRPRSIFLL